MIIQLVRGYDQEVVEKIVALEQESFGNGGMNEWHLVPMIRHGRVFIALEQGEFLGSVQYLLDWEQPQKAYMFGIAITKKWQGKGIGTAFLKETFVQLLNDGIKEVELTVDPLNAAAIKVYQDKLNFAVTEFRKDEYGPGEDRVVMKVLL